MCQVRDARNMAFLLFSTREVICMIVKRKDGYFVLSEKTRRNLGGPYKTREEAVKRLQQVEFFKHIKK